MVVEEVVFVAGLSVVVLFDMWLSLPPVPPLPLLVLRTFRKVLEEVEVVDLSFVSCLFS